MKNKLAIITLVTAIILGLIIIAIVVKNKEENNDLNNNDNNNEIQEEIYNESDAILEEYELIGLEEIVFNNITYYYKTPETFIRFNITNNSDKEITIGYFTISIRDKDNNEMFKMLTEIKEPIAPGETKEELEISTVGNYVDGYTLVFETYKEEFAE